MKNDLIWSKLKQRKQEKDFMKIDHLKKETSALLINDKGSWREQSLYHLVSKWKTKAPNMKNIKDIIICKVLK